MFTVSVSHTSTGCELLGRAWQALHRLRVRASGYHRGELRRSVVPRIRRAMSSGRVDRFDHTEVLHHLSPCTSHGRSASTCVRFSTDARPCACTPTSSGRPGTCAISVTVSKQQHAVLKALPASEADTVLRDGAKIAAVVCRSSARSEARVNTPSLDGAACVHRHGNVVECTKTRSL